LQACVLSPVPQTVKTGAGKLLGVAAICTVTLSAVPPVDQTSILYCAACPGCTVVVAGCTLTQSCVAAGDVESADALSEAPPLGLTLGVELGDGELDTAGRGWHPLVALAEKE
jgi:hypothetical protein